MLSSSLPSPGADLLAGLPECAPVLCPACAFSGTSEPGEELTFARYGVICFHWKPFKEEEGQVTGVRRDYGAGT